MENKSIIETILLNLLKKGEITFDNKEKITDKDEQIKLEIIKLICYKDGKLSVSNLCNNNYGCAIWDSAKSFLQRLLIFKLNDNFESYEPDYYDQIKQIKMFQIYVNLTKKELLPFFLMIGFFSYINLRRNNLLEINNFQKIVYFQEMNIRYLNIKKFILPQIILQYSNLLLPLEKKKVINNEDIEALKNIFNSYSIFNQLYGKGNLYFLVDSIFSGINNFKSIYLDNVNESNLVNQLIETLFDSIYEFIKTCFYDEHDIKNLIKKLYKIIEEYAGFSNQINYILFVDLYCNKFKEDNIDKELFIVCLFFKGLNINNFKETFKKLNFCYGGEHYRNIEKYYNQIKGTNYSEKIIGSSDNKNKALFETKKKNFKYENKIADLSPKQASNISEQNFEKEMNPPIINEISIKKNDKIGYEKNKENLKAKEVDTNKTEANNNELKCLFESQNEKRDDVKEEKNKKSERKIFELEKMFMEIRKKLGESLKKNKELENKFDESEKRKKELEDKFDESEKRKKELENKFDESEKRKKELENKFDESEKENKELEKKLNSKIIESEKKFNSSEKQFNKKLKEIKKKINETESKLKESENKLLYKIKIQNKEINKLKSELKVIKFRDISKIIINDYIDKYSNKLKRDINKKTKVYSIAELLQGKEKNFLPIL